MQTFRITYKTFGGGSAFIELQHETEEKARAHFASFSTAEIIRVELV